MRGLARAPGPSACPVRLRHQHGVAACVHLSSRRTSSTLSTSTALPPPRPDYSALLASPEAAISNLLRRRSPLSLPAPDLVSRITAIHESIHDLSNAVRDLKSERNTLGRILGNIKATDEEKERAKKRAVEVRDTLAGLDSEQGLDSKLQGLEDELLALGLQLPNSTSPLAPVGAYDQCETVRSSPGSEHLQSNPSADHVSLLTALGWLYQPTHITGSSWPYLLRGGAMLESALVQYALTHALRAGFDMVVTPDVVRHEIMQRCGFAPRDAGGEAQTYFVSSSSSPSSDSTASESKDSKDFLALAATSEILLAGYFSNALFRHPSTELPKKLVGTGHAYRAEAGSRGKESRGLYRVHQFTKVELFAVTEADKSDEALQELVELQWNILSRLGVPLRSVSCDF